MDVLFAQRDLLEARTRLLETKQQQLSAIVDAYQALGGGYLMSNNVGGIAELYTPPVEIGPDGVPVPPAPEPPVGAAPGKVTLPPAPGDAIAPPPAGDPNMPPATTILPLPNRDAAPAPAAGGATLPQVPAGTTAAPGSGGAAAPRGSGDANAPGVGSAPSTPSSLIAPPAQQGTTTSLMHGRETLFLSPGESIPPAIPGHVSLFATHG
jgi:hypothetical protein